MRSRASFSAWAFNLGAGGGEAAKDPSKDKSPPKIAEKPKTFVMTPKAWAEERKKDRAAFDTKYRDQTIEMAAVVQGPSFYLQEDPRAFEIAGLEKEPDTEFKCVTKGPDPWWKKALPGQTVKFRGKCVGKDIAFAEILEVSGQPPPTFTVKEILKDPQSLVKKYFEVSPTKYVIIAGEIGKFERAQDEDKIFLKSEEKAYSILCRTPKDPRNLELKSGEKVRVLTSYFSVNENEKRIETGGLCVIMK